MSEQSVRKVINRLQERTCAILDEESFNVAQTLGKASALFDFACFDKGCYKLVKVCYKAISQYELDKILFFNDSPHNDNTIIQVFFWDKYAQKPFYRVKLFYNKPNQSLPDKLQNLVK